MKKIKLLMSFATLLTVATVSAQVTYTCTAGTDFEGDEGVAKLFDGNLSTKFSGAAGDGTYALFTASEPVYVWAYEMTTTNDIQEKKQNVKKWTLYGTNNAEVAVDAAATGWVALSDLGNNNLIQEKNSYTQRFFCEKNVGKSFKYFKLVLNESAEYGDDKKKDGVVQLAEFKVLGETNRVTAYKWKASSQDNSKKALDLLLGQKWEGSNLAGNWVTIETGDGQAYAVKSYSFSTHDDGDWTNRAPKSWKIEGSNDNSTWTLIDEVVDDNVIQNANYTTFVFTPSNTTDKFRYIKLTLNAMKGTGWTQVGEFHVLSTSDVSDAQYYTNLVENAKATKSEFETILGEEDPWCKEYKTFFDGLNLDDVLEAAISSGNYETLETKLAEAENNAIAQAMKQFVNGANYAAFAGSGDKCWGDGHYSQLVDGKESTKWGGNDFTQYIIFRVKEAFKPFFYKLVTGNDTATSTGRNWKTWSVYGGNFESFSAAADSSANAWTLLDERVDISEEYLPMKNFYPATFDFNKGVKENYLYYMVKVIEPHNGVQQQMSEMYLCTEEEFEAIRKPLVDELAEFSAGVADMAVESSLEESKETFATLYNELKTTSDAVRLTKVYNDLVALKEKLEDSAAFVAGGYRVLDGNTKWGDNENWTKLLDGDEKTKWGGGMPEGGSYVIFKVNKSTLYNAYELITGNDTKSSPSRNWKTWKIYGCSFRSDGDATRDSELWTLIDEKTDIGQDQLPADNFAPAYFSFSGTPAKYKHYKIEVEAPCGGDAIQMSEFKMYTAEEWKAVCLEKVATLNDTKSLVFEGKEIKEAVAADVDAAINAVAESKPEELLAKFKAAQKAIFDAPKLSFAEMAAGNDDCILPSIKWGGNYKAFTYVAQGDFDFGDGNTSNPNYNKIIGVPKAQDGKAWYTPEFDATSWNYGKDLPNFGDGRPADVYAVRYFTVEGEIPSTLFMPAPHDDAPCEYYINGELIWSETDGWKEDEVVRLTDSQKALIKTDGSVNVFAFHVHQNWGGRYADGGLYTAGNMVNDYWNDYGNLDDVIAKAEADGIDAAVLDVAKAKSIFRGGINYSRNAIVAAYRLKNVGTQENIFKGSAPVDGGQYYIYNVGAKRYLTGGVDYGTHAAVNFAAQLATFRANGNGFRIHTNIRKGSDALNFNGFVDCGGDGDTWILKEVSAGVYNIARSEEGKEDFLLGYNGAARNNWWQVDTDLKDAADPNNQWMFISKEERDALLKKATSDNPVDATYYIHAAGFDHWLVPADMAWPFTKWTWNNGGDGGWEPDFVYEVWHAGETEMSQTIEGLPAGKYIATVQGYYRDGDNHNNDGTIYQGDRQEAYFFAGDARVLLPNISEGADQYLLRGNNNAGHGIVPDSREDAAAYFGAGLYKVSVETTVGADGKLKIGAIKSANVPNDWMVIDNFRLYYKGNYAEATITDAGYATFVAPGYIDAIPEGVEAYAAQLKEGYVHLEPTSVIPAGEAVVLKGAEGIYTFYPQPVSENTVSTSKYAIDLPYELGDVSYDDGIAIINGEAGCKVIKIGTSKAAGNFTLTVPAGKYSFYAVAWKGSGTPDVVLKNGEVVVKSITIQANDGVTGNSPYTINVTNADKYEFEVASDCTLTITSDKRVVFFGIKSASASDVVLDNDLKPATEEVTADGTQYILAELDGVAGFAKATPETKIAAGKGYLVISAPVKAFYPFGEEDATAIENVNVNGNVNEGAIYNLSGQRVSKLQKGINIVDGKKILF